MLFMRMLGGVASKNYLLGYDLFCKNAMLALCYVVLRNKHDNINMFDFVCSKPKLGVQF